MSRSNPPRSRASVSAALCYGVVGTAIVAIQLVVAGPLDAGQTTGVERHVVYLASDELGGRLTGSDGARHAADYIVSSLEAIGALPLPGLRGYRDPFDFTAGVNDAGSTVALTTAGEKTVALDEGMVGALSFSDTADVSGSVVFAGYGLVIPEGQDFPYDSYATLDVEGKIVLVLRYFPEDVDRDTRAILSRYSGLRYKAMQARERGAEALLVMAGPRSPNAGELVPMTFDTAMSGSGIVAASISGEGAERIFRHLRDLSLEEIQASLDTGNPHITGFEIPDLEMSVSVRVEREARVGYNVVGYLPATGSAPVSTSAELAAGSSGAVPSGSSSAALTDEAVDKPYVVLGAHYDHLGLGMNGNSLARQAEAGGVHHGADDNASGVAAVLAAGAALARMDRDRAVVLAFWSGEELGLLGSADFVQEETLSTEQIAAYMNFDMVGRMRDNRLTLQAVGSSPEWPRLIEQANIPVGFDIAVQEDPYLPTDSTSFNLAGVPTISFFTGSHEDYHRPSDVAEKVNFEDLDRVARFGALMAFRLANLDKPLAFVTVERSGQAAGDRDSVRAFTGTIPDYASDVEGLLLGGVIEGGPAEQAGLRGGDVIVEFAGQKITNIYDYTYALDAVKIDEPVKVVYVRNGERHETTLTPRARR